MTVRLLLLAALILLVVPMAFAQQDFNAMTPEQLQEYIRQLQVQQVPAPQSTVITIQMDEQLRSDISLLKNNMAAMQAAQTKMEERFGRLADDMDARMQANAKAQTADIAGQIAKMFEIQEKTFLEAVRAYTNPLRLSLPLIGVFAMLTGAFLLWASRQYKLTEGIRQKKSVAKNKLLGGA